MKIGIMQPYFFPYIGYWQLISAVDRYVIYDDVNFIKGGWISRNNILLNGKSHLITLPLDNPSSFRLINEIDITQNMKSREKVLKTIEQAYRKAPMHQIVMPSIEKLIMGCKTIAELNIETIKYVCNYLAIATEILVSSELEKDNQLKGQDKVIDIVKRLGGDTYINAIGGKELYSREDFDIQGIKLFFLKCGDVKYRQFTDDFIGNLSIIDLLMFNDHESIRQLLKMYELE